VRREHPKDDYVFVSERRAGWQLAVAKIGVTSTGKLYRKTLAMRPLRCVWEPADAVFCGRKATLIEIRQSSLIAVCNARHSR
jgi:hypothetical protein